MRLAVFNGSPRGSKGNSAYIIGQFAKGFLSVEGNTCETFALVRTGDVLQHMEQFAAAEAALLVFPLYTDSIPAIMKLFIEALEPLCGREGNPALGFIVISGFPEAVHSTFVARYLEKLCRRLGCRHIGTVIRGNAEGIRYGNDEQNKALNQSLYDLGRLFAETGAFDSAITKELAGPLRFPWGVRVIFWLVTKLGLANKGWDDDLKRNNAYEKRFDRPY